MKSGVYAIRCLKNGQTYIGSSSRVEYRMKEHRKNLKLGHHFCKHMQSAYNSYGHDKFAFFVLERVSNDSLIEREQFWLDTIRSQEGASVYNYKPIVDSCLGMKLSEEAKQKISLSKLGKPWTEERKQKARGRKLTEEHKKNISLAGKKLYTSEEYKVKMKELTSTPEFRYKIGRAMRGKKHSEEARQKMSASQKLAKAKTTY